MLLRLPSDRNPIEECVFRLFLAQVTWAHLLQSAKKLIIQIYAPAGFNSIYRFNIPERRL